MIEGELDRVGQAARARGLRHGQRAVVAGRAVYVAADGRARSQACALWCRRGCALHPIDDHGQVCEDLTEPAVQIAVQLGYLLVGGGA